jgi:hypothetical protein
MPCEAPVMRVTLPLRSMGIMVVLERTGERAASYRALVGMLDPKFR